MVGRGAVEADIVAVRLEVEGLEADVIQVFRMKILLVDGARSLLLEFGIYSPIMLGMYYK